MISTTQYYHGVKHLGVTNVAVTPEARTLLVLQQFFPNGHEYCVNSLNGERGKRMKVNRSGKINVWSDFVVGDYGATALDLCARFRWDGEIPDAIQHAGQWLGQASALATARRQGVLKGETTGIDQCPVEDWIVLSVPENAEPLDFVALLGRQPDAVYDYEIFEGDTDEPAVGSPTRPAARGVSLHARAQPSTELPTQGRLGKLLAPPPSEALDGLVEDDDWPTREHPFKITRRVREWTPPTAPSTGPRLVRLPSPGRVVTVGDRA